MTNAPTDKDRITQAWQAAYDDWENGQNTSPSVDDLIAIACEIDPDFPDESEMFYEIACDGHELAEMYDLYLADVAYCRAEVGEGA